MNPLTLRSIRRITIGSAAVIGLGYALFYYQRPRSEEEMFQRLPADMLTQMKQKRYIRDQYEAQQEGKEDRVK